MIIIIAFLMIFPFSVFDYKQTGVPLSDIVCVIGFLLIVCRIYTLEACALILSIFFAFVSLVIGLVKYSSIGYSSVLSLVFLFKPCFAYFAGAVIISNSDLFSKFIKSSAVMSSVLILSVFYSIAVFDNFVVRTDSSINGSFFGVPLFGAYGVNSLAAYYVLLAFMLSLALSEYRFSVVFRTFFFMSLAISFYFILGSLSRMAIIAMSIMYLGLQKDLIKSNFYLGGMLIVVVVFLGASLFSIAYQEGIGVEKINQVINGLAAGDLDYVSSGRLTLYVVALDQVLNSPFSGVSFGGFDLHAQSIRGYENITGLSPHNQYITLFWKMGFPAAFFYIVFLMAVVYRAVANCEKVFRRWVFRLCLIVLIVFSSLWDALLIPNVAALFFFLMGAFSSQGCKLDEK